MNRLSLHTILLGSLLLAAPVAQAGWWSSLAHLGNRIASQAVKHPNVAFGVGCCLAAGCCYGIFTKIRSLVFAREVDELIKRKLQEIAGQERVEKTNTETIKVLGKEHTLSIKVIAFNGIGGGKTGFVLVKEGEKVVRLLNLREIQEIKRISCSIL